MVVRHHLITRHIASWLLPLLAWQASAVPVLAADGAAARSLPQLLVELRQANPDLKAARKRWEAAQARVPLAKSLPAPRIGLEWEEIPKGTVKLNQAMLMYQLIQSLPFPGKLSLRHQVAVKEAGMAAMTFKQREWELASQLKDTYYDLFLLDREREIQAERLGWLSQAVATAQAAYATGMTTQTEALRLQAEALSADNEVSILQQKRYAMAAHLNHLLNRHVHGDVGSPATPPLAFIDFSPDELVIIASERQPELLMFKFAAERAEAAHRLAKRELLPDLETMFELRDPAAGPAGPWDLSLAIAIPFWFWTKWRYGLKGALYDQESAQAAYEAVRNEITRRVHEHWHEARAAYQTAKLCQDGLIGLNEQAVASAMAAYSAGRGSFMQLLEALTALNEQRRTYYEHLVALEQHVIMLEEAVGMPLRARHEPATQEGSDEGA